MTGGVAWRAAGGTASLHRGGAILASVVPAGGDRSAARRGLAAWTGERGAVTVAADARLIRRPELLRELAPEALSPAEPPTDAELILAAYRRWGDDCPDRLLGEFAFVLWDEARRTMLCARDPVGARPLRYALTGEPAVVRVASSPWQILASGAVPKTLDGVALADRLAGEFHDPTRTPFAAVRAVPPGCCVAFGPDGRREWRYWNPERAEVPDATDEAGWVERFRDLLVEVVRDHLGDVSGGLALLTSGGLDSSTIAAIARSCELRGEIAGRPIAFVHVFDRLRSCDEWRWASALVDATGIAVERIPSDELSNLAPDPSVREPCDDPAGLPGELAARALARARDLGCGVLTTGYGGDTLFDAARWRYFDLVRGGRWTAAWPWVAGARARGASWPRSLAAVYLLPLVGRGGRRAVDRLRGTGRYWRAPPWLRPGHRSGAEARRGSPRHPRRFRSRARQDQYEHLVGLAQQGPAIDFWSEAGARYGIEARFPLLDRRLAELVLAAPLALGARPGAGGSKWLLRQATVGILPEPIRLRTGKGSWAAATRDSLCRRLHGEIASTFTGSRLAEIGLIDDTALRAGLGRYCTGRGVPGFHATLLSAAYLTERWLRAAGLERVGIANEDV